jgi:hypothetical protein
MNDETEAYSSSAGSFLFHRSFLDVSEFTDQKQVVISGAVQVVKCSNFLNIVLGMNIELMLYWYIIL